VNSFEKGLGKGKRTQEVEGDRHPRSGAMFVPMGPEKGEK